MTQTATTLEGLLCAAYREEIAAYGRALACADDFGSQLNSHAPADAAVAGMMAALDTVANVEARIASAKRTWQQQHCQPGPDLRALLDEAAQLVVRLLARVEQVEQLAAAHKARLSPELDAASRGRQMQQAYGQAMSHGRPWVGLSSL